jgi:hypothetical protein
LKSKEWPDGLAYKVADELRKKFRPKDMLSKAEQRTKFGHLKFKKEQDPDNFATAIRALQVEYRNKISKEIRTATLVSAAEPLYGETIFNKKEKLAHTKEKEVTYDAIVEKLCKL